MKLRSVLCLLFIFLDVASLSTCKSEKCYVVFEANNVNGNLFTGLYSLVEFSGEETTIHTEPDFASNRYRDPITKEEFQIDYWYYLRGGNQVILKFPFSVTKESCTTYFQGKQHTFIVYAHWTQSYLV